ncbi:MULTISPECIES: peptidoglycan-binding domain-containing protein [unclassified Leptolyngbya]|uniref:peptidoglycan-binding domain-containing protein n=1 Tax=unclassified Leptolyngbya TaxID=2650499 RepID=UPI001682A53A|nr:MULTISPECIES: peptidoglycan-binding domain-containing protein [unclassified Leptolyngbya]MBD1911543.1 peptidoglycan-binding protein [Leptolyngbya sp. FACHB-8]MBD2155577.1 peptidoglycan-binding protein [Leptolyngbya sp. FACHB-16]
MASPVISFKAFHRLSWGLMGAIASTLIVSAGNALAQVVFQYGDNGSAVTAIQQRLGVYPDGDFGSETEQAVIDFQSRYGLEADGVVGPATLDALDLGYLTNVGGPTDDEYGQGSSSAVVRTSGDVLNVRSWPNGEVISSLANGTPVVLTGDEEFAGGLTWAELSVGGWVARNFLSFTGTGGPGDYTPGAGPYVVAIPGNDPDDLRVVRRRVPTAFYDDSSQGSFINAGNYPSRSVAEDIVDDLRDRGIDARLSYRRFR